MFFKKRTAESYLLELAPSVNKKVKEKVNSDSYTEEVQLKADVTKIKDILEFLGSFSDQHYSQFKQEMNSVLDSKKNNRIHLVSCINSYMAYFEEHGGMPKPVKEMTPSQAFLGLYHACISQDNNFYK